MLKDASTNTDDCKSRIWRKKNTPQVLRICNQVRQAEWSRKRSPRVLEEMGPLYQEEMRLLKSIRLVPRDELSTARTR